MNCCGKEFTNKKAFSNHKRWCSGMIKYKGGYASIHLWVRKRKPKPKFCEHCQLKPPRDLANISGEYLRDIKDYLYLCRSCHKKMDITIEIKIKYSVKAKEQKRDKRGCFL